MSDRDQSGAEYIIVADDSAPNRAGLISILKPLGFQVIECDDGTVAWQALDKNRSKKIVAVMSDMMMLRMDGLELLRRVRADDQLTSLPFFLITAVTDKDYIHEAKALKCTGYLLKPVTPKRVLAKLSEIFPDRQFPAKAG